MFGYKLGNIAFYGSIFFIFVVFFSSILIPYSIAEKRDPGSTRYGFPLPYTMDYFQYVSMIKNGKQGYIQFRNQYTEEQFPLTFLQPHYHLLGMVPRVLPIDEFDTFAIARAIALFIFLTTVIISSKFYLPSLSSRAFGLILFISSTSLYIISEGSIIEPETYSNWFNVFKKLTMIPPHHYIAMSIMIFLTMWVMKKHKSLLSTVITAFASLLLAFLHPYISVIFIYILIVQGVCMVFFNRKELKEYAIHSITILLISAPIILYNLLLLLIIWKGQSTAAAGTLYWSPPAISIDTYAKALGPLFFIAIPFLFFPSSWKNKKARLLLIWAFLPCIILYIPYIPQGGLRFFQTYQQLALAFFVAMSIYTLLIKKKRIYRIVLCVLSFSSILFAIYPFYYYLTFFSGPYSNYFNTYHEVVNKVLPLSSYLNTFTPKDSVILTPEKPGMVIPAITENKVILGHEGNNRDYRTKEFEISQFYAGHIPLEHIPEFLDKYNVSFILFGVDAPPFIYTQYKDLPYLKIVKETDAATIVKVE